jgi:hypothetical protein
MLFVASQESAVITEPGNGALDDPSAAIAAQRPAILSQVLGPTVGPVRRDHFDAQFCEGLKFFDQCCMRKVRLLVLRTCTLFFCLT